MLCSIVTMQTTRANVNTVFADATRFTFKPQYKRNSNDKKEFKPKPKYRIGYFVYTHMTYFSRTDNWLCLTTERLQLIG